jgi:hypothetical protein
VNCTYKLWASAAGTGATRTATIATIATIRPTTRNVLFPAKAQASVTAFTRFHNDVTFVNKFHSFSVQSGLRDKGSTP